MSANGFYTPFETPWRLAMGLLRLRPEEWLEVDEALAEELAEKRRLLAGRRADVLQVLPESLAAQRELLAHLVDHLAARHPATHRRVEAGMAVLPAGGTMPLAADGEPPIALAAQLVQEDLCLMQRAADGWRLTAGCVCFPTRWRLAEKLGRPLAAIHAPVPGFEAGLGRPVERFFDHLRTGRPVCRLNWSLLDDPALSQPTGHGRATVDPEITAENVARRLWLRVERQTLSRLPSTGAVVFTIRIHRRPLARLAERPEAAARLAGAVRSMPAAMRGYKSLPVFGEALLTWLVRVAAAQGASPASA